MGWIIENIGTIIVLAAIIAIIGGAAAEVIKNKRSGGCRCGCANCALKGQCRGQGKSV